MTISGCVWIYFLIIKIIYWENERGALNGYPTYIIVLYYYSGREAKASGVIMCTAAWKGHDVGGKRGTRERLIYGARIKFVRQKQPLRSSAHITIYYAKLYVIICKVHRAANVRSRPVYIMYTRWYYFMFMVFVNGFIFTN